MFYKTEVKDHIRVPPRLFDLNREDAIQFGVQYTTIEVLEDTSPIQLAQVK